MYLVLIAWGYVVLMMVVAEAAGPNGTLLGALVTLLLYGVLPMGLVAYLMATPARRRARKAAEASAGVQPDGSSKAAGPAQPPAVAPVREEP